MRQKKPIPSHDANSYEIAFREVVRSHAEPANLLSEIIIRRLKKDGIDATRHKGAIQRAVTASLAIESSSAADGIEIDLRGISEAIPISIWVTLDEVNEAADRLTKAIEETSPELFRTFSDSALRGILDDPNRRLLDLAIEQDCFVRRLAYTWAEAFKLLDIHVALCGELGESWNDILRKKRRRSKDLIMVDVITRLHGRAMAVAREVQVLLKNGFADGALSRWRTVHEISVTARFISERGPEVARLFAAHVDADGIKAARLYNRFANAQGFRPLPKKEQDRLQKTEEELAKTYGKSFLGDYGWAASSLGSQKPNFSDLESAVKLDAFRPYFRLASNTVHAGSKGTYFRLGILGDSELILAGASNAGLEEAGRLLALSLAQVTAVLLTLHPNTDSVVWGRVLLELSSKVEQQFLRAKRRLEREEREMQKQS